MKTKIKRTYILSISKFNKFDSRGSPGGWIRFSFLQNLQIDITGRFTEKIRMIDLYMAELFHFSTIEIKEL